MVKDKFEEFKKMGLSVFSAWLELVKDGKENPEYKLHVERMLDGGSLEGLGLSDEDLFVLLSIQKQYSENVSRTVGGDLAIGNVFYKHKGV